MRKTIPIFATFLVFVSLFFACRKKSNVAPSTPSQKFTGCRVSQITEIGVDTTSRLTYAFTYNNDGTVSTITSHPDKGDVFVTAITYNKNCVIAYTTDNSEALTKDSLVLNAQNKVIYINHYSYNGSPAPNEVYDQYQYDSSGNLTTIISHNYTTISTQIFHWTNGDIAWNTFGTDFYTYVYDPSLYNTGNITARPTDLENYGIGIYTPRHLYSMAIEDSTEDTTAYSYILDAAGKLTTLQATAAGNYTTTTQITYDCE